jgi:hypothetical protein
MHTMKVSSQQSRPASVGDRVKTVQLTPQRFHGASFQGASFHGGGVGAVQCLELVALVVDDEEVLNERCPHEVLPREPAWLSQDQLLQLPPSGAFVFTGALTYLLRSLFKAARGSAFACFSYRAFQMWSSWVSRSISLCAATITSFLITVIATELDAPVCIGTSGFTACVLLRFASS